MKLTGEIFRIKEFFDREPLKSILIGLGKAGLGKEIEAWAVGGIIRDAILGRETADLDLTVAADPRLAADRSSEVVGGKPVLLDDERGTTRIVIKKEAGNVILDFSALRAGTIAEDLAMRDFTINSIAVTLDSLLAGNPVLIDPSGGVGDLQRGILKFTGPDSVPGDPLRMLRAYRFFAELGFQISEEAQALIKRESCLIGRVASERIVYELFRILPTTRGFEAIAAMLRSGLLEEIIPEVGEMEGVEQNIFHHLDVMDHSIECLRNMEELLSEQGPFLTRWQRASAAYLSEPDSIAVLKLSALLHDIGKPRCKTSGDDGRIHFYGHEKKGSGMCEEIASRLRFSSKVSGLLNELVRYHLRIKDLLALGPEDAQDAQGLKTEERAILKFFRRHGDEAVGIMILTLADTMATRGEGMRKDTEVRLAQLFDRMFGIYLDKYLPEITKPKLITGHDLIKKFGMSEGPAIGKILAQIEEARLNGEISGREEAMSLAEKLVGAGK